jgi:hypothetical protein
MTEMSRGDMLRRLDGASKDLLKRWANGPLAAAEPDDKDDTGATTSIVSHLRADDVDEPGEDV